MTFPRVTLVTPGDEWQFQRAIDAVSSPLDATYDHPSYPRAGDLNALLLPGTRYEPVDALKAVFAFLESGAKFVAALHRVHDPENWDVVIQGSHRRPSILRNPQGLEPGFYDALGILGWRGDADVLKALESPEVKLPELRTFTLSRFTRDIR